jgi:hypothetical protein
LADIPIRCPEHQQVDRIVQEIDGLAEILTGDQTHFYRDGQSAVSPNGTGRME